MRGARGDTLLASLYRFRGQTNANRTRTVNVRSPKNRFWHGKRSQGENRPLKAFAP